MADSIKERIVAHLTERLATITIANGYENDLASVQRFKGSGLDLTVVPMVYIRQGMDTVLREKRAFPSIWHELDLIIGVATRQDEADDTRSGDTVLNSLVADVYKCILVDRTVNGLAVELFSADEEPGDLEADVPYLSSILTFRVQYRHHVHDLSVAA